MNKKSGFMNEIWKKKLEIKKKMENSKKMEKLEKKWKNENSKN